MRFCSACAAELAAPPPVRCGRCGRDHWRNAKPGAAGLVVRDGRLLLVRRAHEPWHGAWTAPGGFCDADEHPIVTAEREIREETGIRARVTGFLGIWTGDYGPTAPGEDEEWIAVAYYHAEPLDDDPPRPDGIETAEACWFHPDKLPPPAEVAPADRFPQILEAWRAAVRAGAIVTPLPDRPSSR